jgi:hypothetical protein
MPTGGDIDRIPRTSTRLVADAMKPDFHRVRTRWNQGFMTFQAHTWRDARRNERQPA